MTKHRYNRPRRHGVLLAGAAAVVALATIVACNQDKLLAVESTSRIQAGTLETPANAQLLVSGAGGDFDCAFGAYVVAGGLIGEELSDATQTADRYPYDQRVLTPKDARYSTFGCTALGVYSPLQTARVSANNVRRLLEGWTDQEVANRSVLLATATAYEAYSMLLLGEGFCSTVFSTFNPDKTTNFGTEITSQTALDSAIARFTQAIDVARAAGSGAQNILNLALVGRARARLDRGDLAGARADAAQVPASFRYDVTASLVSARRYNRVWADNGVSGTGPITPTTAINSGSSVAAPYQNLGDPRVPVDNSGRFSGTRIPIYVQRKYTSADAPIRLASGAEAQLIIAEADLQTNPSNSLAIINTFRAQGNEAALPAGTTGDALKAALIQERRREFFLEGQHLGDLIRYNLPLDPPAGAPFQGGGVFGSQRCMPLPDAERLNNPALVGSA